VRTDHDRVDLKPLSLLEDLLDRRTLNQERTR
jgi:hypothetical protein